MLQEKKPSKLAAKKRQQKQTAASVKAAESAAGDENQEPSSSLADTKEASGAGTEQAASSGSGEASGDPPEGKLLGGYDHSESEESSVASLSSGPGVSREDLSDTGSTQMAYQLADDTAISPPSSAGTAAAGRQRADEFAPEQPARMRPRDAAAPGSMPVPGRNLLSDTCVSRDADTLTMNAGENTGSPAAVRSLHSVLASGQPSPHRQRVSSEADVQVARAYGAVCSAVDEGRLTFV